MKLIDVHHECVDGWHEFTSPHVPGLYIVAEKDDLEAAFEDLPVTIANLIKADYKIDVTVRLEHTYDEYVDNLPPEFRPSIRHYSIERLAA